MATRPPDRITPNWVVRWTLPKDLTVDNDRSRCGGTAQRSAREYAERVNDFLRRVNEDLAKQEASVRSEESRARDAARKQEELYALAIPTLRQLPTALEAAGVPAHDNWTHDDGGRAVLSSLADRFRYHSLGKGWRVGGRTKPIVMLRQDGRFDAIEVKHGGPKGRRPATPVEVLEALSPFYSGAWLAGDANSLLLAGHSFHNDVQHTPFDDVLLSFVRGLQSAR